MDCQGVKRINPLKGRCYMDPEERLWFIEQAVLCSLSVARRRDYLGFEDASDPDRFVDLQLTDRGVNVELGLCEYTCRHLGLSAAASSWLLKDGWRRDGADPWSCFSRRGLMSDGIAMARLVEAAYLRAYELPIDFAVTAIFEADVPAHALDRILSDRCTAAWRGFTV